MCAKKILPVEFPVFQSFYKLVDGDEMLLELVQLIYHTVVCNRTDNNIISMWCLAP